MAAYVGRAERAKKAAGETGDADGGAAGDPALLGSWTRVRGELGGHALAETPGGGGLEIDSDTLRFVESGKPGPAIPHREDVTREPHAIDLGMRGMRRFTPRIAGIYQVEGGELTICMAGAKGRPKGFATTRDGGESLVVYRRAE